MARETGDLWPQTSGSSALGAEMTNRGFTGAVRPFSHVHQMSGIFHSALNGASGILRFQTSQDITAGVGHYFGFSFDGGKGFPLELGLNTTLPGIGADILAPMGGMRVQASGEISLVSLYNDAFLASIQGNVTILTPNQLTIQSTTGSVLINSDNEVHQVDNNYSATVGATWSVSADSAGFTSVADFSVLAQNGGISFETQSPQGDINLNSVADTMIEAFNHSGILSYRFGPYQAWHAKTGLGVTGGPYGDGYWPIPNSGNVKDMITRLATLQTAYDAGSTITTTKNQPVRINGSTGSALRLELAEDQFIHIEMSGLLRAPSSTRFSAQGYLVLVKHGMNLNDGIVSSITNQAFIDAASMGLPTLWMHCGQSGIAPMRLGSGVSQFFNVAASNTIDEIGLYSPITPASQAVPDRFFAGVSSSGVKVMVPGLYKALYSASIEKTAGELEQQINCELRVNDQWGNAYRIFGGASYATVRDSGNNPNNTANGQCIFDIGQGETINIFGQTSVIPVAPNSCRFRARSVNLILEYLGPQHGIGSVRQKI